MNSNQEKNSIKDRILNEIKKGDIKMHPKFTYALKAIFVILAVLILIAIMIFLMSFIVFSLENNGAQFLVGSGIGGVLFLMHSLPWVLILIILIAILLIESLIKRFKFAYRRPLIYSLLVVLVAGVACGLLMHHESFHRGISCLINDAFYEEKENINLPNTYKGKILESDENFIRIEEINGKVIEAIFPTESFGFEEREIERGDRIIFIGPKKDAVINISSYRKLNCGCGGCDPDDLKR
ncbi:MAG: hypothetical protein NT058_00240 [Candidatus Portnoybacteria bacterium]|nr:hypothetical protein [Candidatus Portnoybacteria bacterium]